jgi:hypothetical protein
MQKINLKIVIIGTNEKDFHPLDILVTITKSRHCDWRKFALISIFSVQISFLKHNRFYFL